MPRPSLKEQLLVAGLETFHRRGFNATSVQDITDAAGAPKGSFYNHFESKEALAVEAVHRYQEKGRARLAILRETRLAPLRRLRKYFETLVGLVVEAEFNSGCLLGNFASELSGQSPAVREAVAGAFELWSDEIARVIGEAQQGGAVPSGASPKALADFALEAWEGAQMRARAAKDRAPLDLFLKLTFAKILG